MTPTKPDKPECRDCDWPEWGRHVLEELKGVQFSIKELKGEMAEMYRYVDKRMEISRESAAAERRRLFERTETLGERATRVETKLVALMTLGTFIGSIVGGLIVALGRHAMGG